MTPFAEKLNELRDDRKMSHDALAKSLQMTPVELSSLLNGYAGLPSPVMLFRIERALQLSRYEFEDLKAALRHSNPLVTINLAGRDAGYYDLVHKLAAHLGDFPPRAINNLRDEVNKIIKKL